MKPRIPLKVLRVPKQKKLQSLSAVQRSLGRAQAMLPRIKAACRYLEALLPAKKRTVTKFPSPSLKELRIGAPSRGQNATSGAFPERKKPVILGLKCVPIFSITFWEEIHSGSVPVLVTQLGHREKLILK